MYYIPNKKQSSDSFFRFLELEIFSHLIFTAEYLGEIPLCALPIEESSVDLK